MAGPPAGGLELGARQVFPQVDAETGGHGDDSEAVALGDDVRADGDRPGVDEMMARAAPELVRDRVLLERPTVNGADPNRAAARQATMMWEQLELPLDIGRRRPARPALQL